MLHKVSARVQTDKIVRISDIIQRSFFEFGVAEGAIFNYLDKEELDRFHRRLAKNPMSTIDVFCVVRYHLVNKKKRTPLRFDYHVLRFTFDKNNIGLQILHDRGTQRIPLEGLVKFITKRIRTCRFRANNR